MIWSNHPAPFNSFDKRILAASHRARQEPDEDNPDPLTGPRTCVAILLCALASLPFWTVVVALIAGWRP